MEQRLVEENNLFESNTKARSSIKTVNFQWHIRERLSIGMGKKGCAEIRYVEGEYLALFEFESTIPIGQQQSLELLLNFAKLITYFVGVDQLCQQDLQILFSKTPP